MDPCLFMTRKRKKWKFHHFNEWAHCWQSAEISARVVSDFIDRREVTLEIGAGTADVSLELARRHTKTRFIAIDLKSDRLYTGAKKALGEQVNNIRFLRAYVDQLGEVIPKNSVGTIWITFPDPYPRKKSAKHRLTHPQFLQLYETLLRPDGVIRFKTDNKKLFDWSREQFEAEGWKIIDATNDLHTSSLPKECKITTAYERRFIAEGLPINYLKASYGTGF